MLLTVDQICEFWCVSHYIASKWINTGLITPVANLGRKRFFNYMHICEKLGPPTNVIDLITHLRRFKIEDRSVNND